MIGLVDNLLRPMLVGKATLMPDYVVMITTLGGMVAFGINQWLRPRPRDRGNVFRRVAPVPDDAAGRDAPLGHIGALMPRRVWSL